jgi:hypothetical protein
MLIGQREYNGKAIKIKLLDSNQTILILMQFLLVK